MDSLENIILFVFIIFSIISSIMKKKKRADAKAEKKSPQVAKKSSPSIMDIFQEMTKATAPQAKTESEVDAYFLEAQKEVEKLNSMDERERSQESFAAKSYSTFKEPTLIKPENTRFDLTYDNSENELNLKNKNLHKFRALLHNPKSLQDYVLMKEILDKPKALQKL